MKKKIILEFEKGINPKYKKWTKEAAQKFVSFFPEFKDNFEISFEGPSFLSKAEVEDIVLRSTQVSAQDVWDMFEKQADGSYLRKNSVDWQINQASTNGKVDLHEWLTLKGDGRATVSLDEPLRVSVAARATTFAYGISDPALGPCLSAAACGNDEAYFKDIVMHELGHAFDATHENRKNVVEQLGLHCTDADCLMYKEAYTPSSFARRQAQQKDNPFCDDCMVSMRNFMENTLKMTNRLQMINLDELPFFKDIKPCEMAAIDRYEEILRENNIQRSAKDKLFDMMSIYTSSRSSQQIYPDKEGHIFGEDKFLLATAQTKWDDALKLKRLQDKIYSMKRYVTYTAPVDFNDDKDKQKIADLDAAMQKQGNLARVSDEGYWIRKYGQGYFDNIRKDPNQDCHRYILNVNPDVNLFEKLDEFAVKYNCQYKFPNPLSWNQRVDTVVIYTSDKRITEQQNELIQIAKPYVRTERATNSLDGNRLADGVFMAKERDKADILALAAKAKQNLPELAIQLTDIANSSSHRHPLSLGEFLSYQDIIDTANLAANNNYQYRAKEIDFDKPDIRSLKVIHNHLKADGNPLAEDLNKETDKHEAKFGCKDYSAMAQNPVYQQARKAYETSTPTKTVTISHDTNLPPNNSIDKSFKKGLREVFEPSAKKEGSEYKENLRAQNYEAEIKHPDGSIDKITASSATNLNLSAQDKDGNNKLPEMQRFHDIAEYTHRQNSFVSFGDIKTPEFKARLILACMTHVPPVKMKGQPEVNPEFLNSLDAALKKQLEKAINPPKPRQTPPPQRQGGR